jgi:hypothetical protein
MQSRILDDWAEWLFASAPLGATPRFSTDNLSAYVTWMGGCPACLR